MAQMAQQNTDAVILKNRASDLNTDAEQKFRSRNWSFTLNNYTEKHVEKIMAQNIGKIIVGKETGNSGTKHLQGYLELTNPRTLTGLKKALEINEIHLEPSYKNRHANMNYCLKDNDILRNDFGLIYTGQDLPKLDDLYDWQKLILSIIDKPPDDRYVYWFYEPVGNSGKSKFGKYLAFHHKVSLLTATKSADILTAVDDKFTTYVLDFPRHMEQYFPYNAMEQLKNGFITDSKLKKSARTVMFNPPHVICFSNTLPDTTKLSRDRWQIYNIYLNQWELP